MPKQYVMTDPKQWLEHVLKLRAGSDVAALHTAIALYTHTVSSLSEKGLGIADILLSLGLDNTTLAVALIYPLMQEAAPIVHLEWLEEDGNKLLQDILQMQALGKLQQLSQRDSQQTENLRKMLLAMMTDVRAVLIMLAERLWKLRQAQLMPREQQQKLAQETLDVYAPLANRLGVWQLKWEIEDLCLLYLQPEAYDQIAKGLAAERKDREAYIQQVSQALTDMLQQAGIQHFQLNGRVKHIYSIYKKMVRKHAHLEEIYDVSALRVLVSNTDDCYSVLSILHNAWQQYTDEFDDYIAHPKSNGYQSIHTVVRGPQDHFIEVQIRTYQMHHESELGVAAHWRYKEGVLQLGNYEAKIALLRQIMAWQKDMMSSADAAGHPIQDLFADRVYVFTPMGEIMDLEQGATPLDFAYHIHSEVGHRCRGAKVDGNIVPLTYALQTGERIEILTAKQANPSRDWLSSQHGFLKTARARSKVQHWFRVKDSAQNMLIGRDMLDRELKRLGYTDKIDLYAIALKLNYKSTDTLLSALGAGDIRVAQIIHHIQPVEMPDSLLPEIEPRSNEQKAASHVQIVGINNLLTHIALCCKPLPGDAIVGYVTRNRGISVHRRDCGNILHVIQGNHARLMEVSWGEQMTMYPTELVLRVYDRAGLLRDITALLAVEKINVSGLKTQPTQGMSYVDIYLTIETTGREQLSHALNLLQQIPHVIGVKRR